MSNGGPNSQASSSPLPNLQAPKIYLKMTASTHRPGLRLFTFMQTHSEPSHLCVSYAVPSTSKPLPSISIRPGLGGSDQMKHDFSPQSLLSSPPFNLYSGTTSFSLCASTAVSPGQCMQELLNRYLLNLQMMK